MSLNVGGTERGPWFSTKVGLEKQNRVFIPGIILGIPGQSPVLGR